jgi:hypothetical protein
MTNDAGLRVRMARQWQRCLESFVMRRQARSFVMGAQAHITLNRTRLVLLPTACQFNPHP